MYTILVIIVLSVNQSDLLCIADDLCQILGMFSLNSIGYVTKSAVLLAFWGKYNRQMYEGV